MLCISYEELKDIIDISSSMLESSKMLGVSFSRFKRIAIKHGLYKPNQGRKGIKRESYENDNQRIPLDDILTGKCPYYSTSTLSKRILKENVKENKCEICYIKNWQGKELTLHLDHIDGDNTNHRLENLRMLCPNCHSQTETYCSKNKLTLRYKKLDFLKSVSESKNFTELKIKLGLSRSGSNETLKNKMNYLGINFGDNRIGELIEFENQKNEIVKEIFNKLKIRKKIIDSELEIKIRNKNIIEPKSQCDFGENSIKYCKCGNKISHRSSNCKSCAPKKRKVERPTYDQLLLDVESAGYSATGRKYGVSDNSVRKWIKSYEKKYSSLA